MDPMTLLGLGQLATGGIQSLFGWGQKAKGNKLLAGLNYPTYNIPQEVLTNQKMAENRAMSGLPSAQYNKAQQDIQRQVNSSIASASDRRGGLATIGATQQQANDAELALNVENAKQRIANEKTLYGINSEVAGYRDKKWQNDVKDRYDRDYNYAMSLKGAGNQGVNAGIDKALGGAITTGYGLFGNRSNYSNPSLFGTGGRSMTASATPNATRYYNGNTARSRYSDFQAPDFEDAQTTPILPTNARDLSALFGNRYNYRKI